MTGGAVPVQFVVTGLAHGGAERMLWKLLARIDRRRFRPHVLALAAEAPMAAEFASIDVPVRVLGLRRSWTSLAALPRLARLIRDAAPRLVQTWMYHADLLGGLAAHLAGRLPVVWNVRHSDLGWRTNRWSTLLAARACAALSRRIPRRIVCCAEAARRSHEALGYDGRRMRVIPNGFDVDAGPPPRPEERARRRDELGLPESAFVVGLVARYHPQKDHRTFLEAARRMRALRPAAHFVLCGDGVDPANRELAELVRRTGCPEAFLLLGPRADAAQLSAAFDVAVSSSRGEGFSNAVGEAMLSGTPCVVTDAGDSAALVGDTGLVVPPGDPVALCTALERLARRDAGARRRLGERARARIVARYSLGEIAARYEALYEEVLAGC